MAKPMRIIISLAASLCCCSVGANDAQALSPRPTPQMYVDNNKGGSIVVPNGKLSFDGKSFSCGSFPTVLDPLLNDYAAAPYPGFLIINPTQFAKVPIAVKLWIFYHECAHVLGVSDETQADCYSAKRGRRSGWLQSEGLEQVCEFIGAARGDATHQAGPDRCSAIRACFNNERAH